jgi:transcriptional regulator with XRE-family HTH domain
VTKPAPEELRVRARIAAHLRRVMHERRWSQSDLSRALGFARTSMSRIISGDRTPGLDVLLRMRERPEFDLNEVVESDPPAEFFTPGIDADAHRARVVENVLAGLTEVLADEGLPAPARRRLGATLRELESVAGTAQRKGARSRSHP